MVDLTKLYKPQRLREYRILHWPYTNAITAGNFIPSAAEAYAQGVLGTILKNQVCALLIRNHFKLISKVVRKLAAIITNITVVQDT
jgi:hypothetical protein